MYGFNPIMFLTNSTKAGKGSYSTIPNYKEKKRKKGKTNLDHILVLAKPKCSRAWWPHNFQPYLFFVS